MKTLIKHFFGIVTLLLLSFTFSSSALAVEKRIEVDLTNQRLHAYEENEIKWSFVISTGKTVTPTPVGQFWPWIKLRYDRMRGGSWARGDYYDLPNVPYVVYYYNERYPKWLGYAIHGTYWHNNFGYPMSHGCVNLKTEDMAILYPWIDLPTEESSGTAILVSGNTPRS